MDIEAARSELMRAAQATERSGPRLSAACEVLVDRGVEALGITPRPGLTLEEIIRIAGVAPATEARRAFAVLLVHALGIEGLLPARGDAERDLRSFLEQALLNPLRRAGYPFDGMPYDKRQVLARLHTTIDDHLRPLEPSIPLWLHGTGARDKT